MGAERDRIVDEMGVKEMATFLDTQHIVLPTVPHEVSLSLPPAFICFFHGKGVLSGVFATADFTLECIQPNENMGVGAAVSALFPSEGYTWYVCIYFPLRPARFVWPSIALPVEACWQWHPKRAKVTPTSSTCARGIRCCTVLHVFAGSKDVRSV